MDQFWMFCNNYMCRVVEFYTGDGANATTCPACGNQGDEESQ